MLGYDILTRLQTSRNMTASQLADELKEKISNIRKELDYLQAVLPQHGASLTKKRGRGNGYELKITDQQKFAEYCRERENENDEYAGSPQYRIEVICERLLSYDRAVKSEDLAAELMISVRQLNNDLKTVRNFLRDFNLEIRNRPYHGMTVEGEEFNKRLCLANLYMRNYQFTLQRSQKMFFDNAENDLIVRKIRKIILDEAVKRNIRFSDVALENLIIHLFIIVKRPSITEDESIQILEDSYAKEKEMTSAIINRISEEFNVTFNSYDFQYIAIHIAGKRAYLDNEVSLIPDEANDLYEELITQVDENYKTDFRHDENLKLRLQLHFAPLIIRIRNGILSTNPLAQMIKSKYAMAYEIALLAYNIVEQKYGVKLTEDELAYIAMYFELAMYETKQQKYRILLVCHTGKVSSEILKQQIKFRFSDYISELESCSLNMVEYMEPDKYSFILSTVPLNLFTATPVYIIRDFLDDNSIKQIKSIFEKGDSREETVKMFFPIDLFMGEIEAGSREEAISIMCEHVRKHRAVKSDFYHQVMEREEMAPTDYGNNVAIPHPMHMDDTGQTWCAVAILNKPVRWKTNNVRVVMLNNISKKTANIQNYYYLLSHFITDEKQIEKLTRNPDYENMIRLIMEDNE